MPIRRAAAEIPESLDIDDGDFRGNRIFTDVEALSSAWLRWNLVLDERGGPRLVSPAHGNPDDNATTGS